MTLYQIPNPDRPRRPVAVKRLRRSCASLRPLRGDCAGSARQGAVKSRCCAKAARRAAFRQQHDLETKGQRRAERSRLAKRPRSGLADECFAFAAT